MHRTIKRSLVAQSQGRTPGISGWLRASKANTSKVSHEKLRTLKKPATYGQKESVTSSTKVYNLKKPAAYGHKENVTSSTKVYKKPAMKNTLSLLEVCAYPGSSLSHSIANTGQAAVRIAHRKQTSKPAKPGPEPVIWVNREGL